MESEACDIAVVGAGAAGLAAAIFAAETRRDLRIILLDGAEKIGAKILISGGGRCNVTHDEVHVADFNGAPPVVRNVLAAFDERATVRWFASMGVELKREDTGKLFPVSDKARTVLEALLRRCATLNVSVRAGHRVDAVDRIAETVDSPEGERTNIFSQSNDFPTVRAEALEARPAHFVVEHAHGTLRTPSLILATGGRSLSRTGSDGAGWEIVRRLGHTVTETYPALVPLILARTMFHATLSGLSQPVELSTFADGKLIDRRTGSLLWTHFGVSGPVVMDASRHWVVARATSDTVEMRCSFVPGQSFEQAGRWLIDAAAARPRLSLRKLLAAAVPERFAAALLRALGLDPVIPVGQLMREQRRALVHALTAFVLPIEEARSWDYAEVTAGGVPLDEIDYRTMASRRVPGLYLIGEMLDCDGRIGGYNFQWAWATGHIAGRAAAQAVMLCQSERGG